MRKRGLWGLAILLIAFVGCTMVPIIPVHAADVIVPGVSLADVPVGMPISEVVARFGAPSQVRLADASGTLAYVFGQYGITVYARSNVVIALATTNSVIATVRGVGLGAPAAAVAAAFGPARVTGIVEGFSGPVYQDLGIAFGLDRQTVAAVMVFKPTKPAGSSPSAPPATPSPSTAPSVGSLIPQDQVTTSAQAQVGQPATAPAGVPSGEAPAGPTAPTDAAQTAAAPAPTGGGAGVAVIPNVSRLRAFSSDTQYLSIAGYVRYLIYGMTHTWLDLRASEQLIREAAGREATGPVSR